MDPILMSNIVILCMPIIVAIVVYIYNMLVARLPGAQRKALQEFTTMAVHYVEQFHKRKLSSEKKELAIDAVQQLFREYNLPIPSDEAIEVAIESSVLMLKVPAMTPVLTGGPVVIKPPMANPPIITQGNTISTL